MTCARINVYARLPPPLPLPPHQNIVDLLEVIIDGNPTPGRLSTVALVFEYLDHDLSGLLDTPEAANQITPALAKSFMMQLAAGVSGRGCVGDWKELGLSICGVKQNSRIPELPWR